MPYLELEKYRLFYKEEGSGEPLLLIMGLGADGETWRAHADVYNKKYRCIMIDNRGAGNSDAPQGLYTTEQMAADAVGLLDALNIKKAHVSGISMGGAIAQHTALLRPDLVHSLTLVSTWAGLDNYGRRVFDMLSAAYKTHEAREFARLLQLWIFSPKHYADNPADLDAREQASADNPAPMSADAFAAQCSACSTHNTLGKLSGIKCPTLITVGTNDIFTPPVYSRELYSGIKNSTLELFQDYAHTHHWEDMERFNKLTVGFLERNKF